MESIYLALIGFATAIATAIIAPTIISWQQNKYQREQKKEDRVREDEIAARAAKVAELLLAANERVAHTAEIANGKLDIIHTLVNSNMTASMQAELNARQETLALLLEIVEMKKTGGLTPNNDTLVLIEAARARISELEAALSDRLRQP